MTNATTILQAENLTTRIGHVTIHEQLNLTVNQGEIIAIVGGSGSGKTTLLRSLMGLLPPVSGSIKLFNEYFYTASVQTRLDIESRFGVLFQQNALFSSLTLLENVAFPLKEYTNLGDNMINELAMLKISMAGLTEDATFKYPAELSGGMQKRAGLARAIALDPELLFLDEPTSGLDPNTAAGFDELILNLQKSMGLTIVMVTHDLDSLWTVANRVAFLAEKRVFCVGTMFEMMANKDPKVQAFFNGPRGRMVKEARD